MYVCVSRGDFMIDCQTVGPSDCWVVELVIRSRTQS